MMDRDSRIYVAGHKGLVGSALVRALKNQGYNNIIEKTHKELDLTNQALVAEFFQAEKPEYVFLAAAKVGGIAANSAYPADFIMENELIQCNVIKSSWDNSVKKLMFFGSSCMYPRICPQPVKEDYLLTGPVEPTNEAYAMAKISGVKMCQYFNTQYETRFISVIPSNLYGPYDNFDPSGSHVIPGLIRKMDSAKTNNESSVEIWGTGSPIRDFLYVDDMVNACLYLMQTYKDNEPINIGTGRYVSIKKLAELIKEVTGYPGELKFDASKPDGAPMRVLDASRLEKAGWKFKIDLEEGLRLTYEFYQGSAAL
ncbi:MAG: GDP-L-fucose synthase family protein [Desulfitobacteriaceae bacterium]